ncbi:MAG TPA: hypothetical protein VMH86_01500 [Rhizomicrobium sp.]|nr:hypothetical protein [Rhizomicrobium sp.]
MRDRYAAMIPLPEYRKLLGSYAAKLTEQEIVDLRKLEFEIADAIFDAWLRMRRNGFSFSTGEEKIGAQ